MFILVDIIIGQLKYFMRDLHLIQVIFGIAAVLLDSLESHPPLVFLLESVYDGNLRQSTLLARRWGYLTLPLAGDSPMKFFIFLKYLGEESVEAIGRSYGFVISPLLLRGFFLKSWILPIFTEFTSSWGSLLWFSGCLGFLSIHGLFIVRNWFSIRPGTTNLSPIQPSTPPTTLLHYIWPLPPPTHKQLLLSLLLSGWPSPWILEGLWTYLLLDLGLERHLLLF